MYLFFWNTEVSWFLHGFHLLWRVYWCVCKKQTIDSCPRASILPVWLTRWKNIPRRHLKYSTGSRDVEENLFWVRGVKRSSCLASSALNASLYRRRTESRRVQTGLCCGSEWITAHWDGRKLTVFFPEVALGSKMCVFFLMFIQLNVWAAWNDAVFDTNRRFAPLCTGWHFAGVF